MSEMSWKLFGVLLYLMPLVYHETLFGRLKIRIEPDEAKPYEKTYVDNEDFIRRYGTPRLFNKFPPWRRSAESGGHEK